MNTHSPSADVGGGKDSEVRKFAQSHTVAETRVESNPKW